MQRDPAPPNPAAGRARRRTAVGARGLRAIAGAGLIEAKRENIPIGTLVAGVVTEVYVKRGDMVKKGRPAVPAR